MSGQPRKFLRVTLCIVVAIIWLPLTSTFSRQPEDSTKPTSANRLRQRQSLIGPTVMNAAHQRGNMQLVVSNNGTFGGSAYSYRGSSAWEEIQPCEYPRRSEISYLGIAGLWVGAVVGRDTLVSCGATATWRTQEFWPDLPELGGTIKYASIDRASDHYDPAVTAYSEEDVICEYTDTLTDPDLVGYDWYDQRTHRPLNIKVTQRSMSWSYEYADDFVILDYNIENIGDRRLNKIYVGIFVDGSVSHPHSGGGAGWADDISGFLGEYPSPDGCGFVDSINVAYHADNDGDPLPWDVPSYFDFRSPRGVVGAKILGTPNDSLEFSYNWWVRAWGSPTIDWGPRLSGDTDDPFRDFGYGLGRPTGDRNHYYMLRHAEKDYDQLWSTVYRTLEGWLPPHALAEDIADGMDTYYLLSFGPFDLNPGQTLPFTFAWVAGDNFHVNPSDFYQTWHPKKPWLYYNRLDFTELATNARWASWVFDNPGVDTDGDGYFGKVRVCEENQGGPVNAADSFWYEGDGVPDFRGAGPPPAPLIRVIPAEGQITVRFNGYYSETTEDIFAHRSDFEGYRVYAGLTNQPSSFSLVHSYDREDYKRYSWYTIEGGGHWKQDRQPYSMEQLREMYNNPDFEPLDHPRAKPLQYGYGYYYFEEQDYNFSELSAPGIHKVYPNATDPGSDSELWSPEDLVYDYEEPLPKFYEYEYVYTGLLPTVPYHMAVTAFDYGSPISGLKALETKPELNAIGAYPQALFDDEELKTRDVYIYPNPYRIDARYAERGYEVRETQQSPDRVRRIHFANLPKVCTISIYSLDGDLIREIDHNFPEGGHLSMHDSWDLITRNTQAVVTGLYIWVVQSDQRTQMGKLAIIK